MPASLHRYLATFPAYLKASPQPAGGERRRARESLFLPTFVPGLPALASSKNHALMHAALQLYRFLELPGLPLFSDEAAGVASPEP